MGQAVFLLAALMMWYLSRQGSVTVTHGDVAD